tara:strand:+ start:2338 stop:2640 length:303 start_codon:yes stop_codon:yes gene_type:complete
MSKIEDEVCEEIQARAERGLNKYGVTMEREDLTIVEWLQHALEESLDLAVYLKRLQHEIAFLQKRNEWLEEVVALLQESGVDLSEEGFPIWNEDGTITRE